jgi:S-DNA-T family DNA segregation ATPase FtsK/SpoIIIE
MDTIVTFDNILKSFNIKAACVGHRQVDNYSYYDVKLFPKAKVRDIQKFSDEIALALKTPCRPSIKVLRDAGVVRLEFAAPRTKALNLFDYFTNSSLPKGEINCLLGQSVDGRRVWMDLAQNPHMLIAGTTGSGKSTLLHNIIANLLNYNDVDLFLVDPKRIEFGDYEKNIKSVQVFYSYDDTLELLNNLIEVMESRYAGLRGGDRETKNIKPMVVIIDEFADLIMQDKDDQFYVSLCRLAQKCRAARIHIILATQRPSVNIINGSIKANFPARIACRVAGHVDSKVILDTSGAENLLGKGDALIRDNFRHLERFQVAYTTAQEVCNYFGDSNASISA